MRVTAVKLTSMNVQLMHLVKTMVNVKIKMEVSIVTVLAQGIKVTTVNLTSMNVQLMPLVKTMVNVKTKMEHLFVNVMEQGMKVTAVKLELKVSFSDLYSTHMN